MKSKIGILLAAVTLTALPLVSSALAGNSWICAINEAVAVDEDGTIGPPEMDGLAAPTFLRVDADRKKITLLAPEPNGAVRSRRSTPYIRAKESGCFRVWKASVPGAW